MQVLRNMAAGGTAVRATHWAQSAWNARQDRNMAAADAGSPNADRLAVLGEADDRTLVGAFQAGEREAFDVIVVRHRRNVYQLCYRFVNNHEDASDLAQDVFVRAFKGLRNFKGDASLATWLYRVAVNACLNRVSAKRPIS